jgi:succinoglycan biosynthesis protein ExoA
MNPKCLIVIPTLNEAKHLPALLDKLLPEAEALDARIVVADGGSTDGTQAIAMSFAEKHPLVLLLHNPRRLQSAAINLAARQFGGGVTYLIRIDAHGDYPSDYCQTLVEEAERHQVESVVVPMTTIGVADFQRAVATAQNSLVGTGGSAHRTGKAAGLVDHGHHALMKLEAFQAVGGYDESFHCNEDAELDYRLLRYGYRIWLTDRTFMTYFPRSTVPSLFWQYFRYGGGRARNILKHRMVPRLRQMVPLAILPTVLMAALSIWHWGFLVPLALWGLACIALGSYAARKHYPEYGLPLMGAPLVTLAAMTMHLAWSSGFWMQLVRQLAGRRNAA